MKIIQKISIVVLSLALLFSFSGAFAAATPTLSLSNAGSGDSVILSVSNADTNAPVQFYYYSSNSANIQVANAGTTNSTGQFWTVLSTATYSISPNSSVYVTVDGAQSSSQVWPYVSGSGGTTGNLSLSQTSLVLQTGQSSTVTVYNSGTNSIYLLNNTNPSIANISISGSQITVVPNANGSTVATICIVGNSSNCSSLYVTVQNTASQALSFSQNNVTVATGQSVPVTVSGGTGVYSITNNSNSNIIQAYLSGATVTLSAVNSSGSDAITVCTTDMSSCGIINASVGTVSSTGIVFSQTNPIMAVGQSNAITVSGGSGSYSLSSNSNSAAVQASLNNNILTLFGNTVGTAAISICSTTGGCGSLTVTVSSAGSGGALTLSQTSLALAAGQTASISVSGGSTPYSVISNSNNIASASLNGNLLAVTGVGGGSTSIAVCSAGGGCTSLYVIVNGTASAIPTTAAPSGGSLALGPLLSVGQTLSMSISGGTGSYYLSSGSNSLFTAAISGSNLVLSGLAVGSGSVSICSTNSTCASFYVTVASGASVPVAVSTPASGKDGYKFLNPLTLGDQGTGVIELQKRLTAEGVYSGPITGYYGSLTETAVQAYQSQHGLNTLGNVGPGTRAALNQ
jgi:hypothetical protein